MIESIINCKNIKDADCLILTAGYDRTSSLGKGASKGGNMIVKCLHQDIEFFDRYNLMETNHVYKIAHKDLGISNKMLPEQMVKKIKNDYLKLINDKRLLILLGGDHSVSSGVFQAISKKYDSEDITVFQIDAHCDLRDNDANANPDQSYVSKFAHSCVMRRASEMDFNIVQAGIRSYAKEEYDFFQKSNRIQVFEWRKNIPTIEEIIKSIKTRKVYITLDIDGIDPAHMPATGTPVPGGLEWYYAIKLLSELIKKKDIIGFDIVEVAPRDNDELTQFAAAQLCYYMIGNCLIKNKKV
ncbi:MAG: agmatinase [Candidatus Gribaldobacteria bacterium]|nr:agmatinase [Candidatus Gribaldobacteria bacterium]